MNLNNLYNTLIDNNYFTSNELDLLTDVCGYNIETLDNAIYARYGYQDCESFLVDENIMEEE